MSKSKARFMKAIKIAVGAFLAITIASFLGLQNSVSAGIITLLSIQNTKKETFVLAGKRLGAFAVSLLIAFVCFRFMGFQTFAFAVYLFVFSILCIYSNLQESISVCAVLISHILLAKAMPFSLMINQFLVLIIGAGVGVVLNLYMGSKVEFVQQEQEIIDSKIRKFLFLLSDLIVHKATVEELLEAGTEIQSYMDKAMIDAEQLDDNVILRDYSYYPSYLQLRKNQAAILAEFLTYNFKPKEVSHEEEVVAAFIYKVGTAFHQCNDVTGLLRDVRRLFREFQKAELPATREEFESRAILYGQLRDMESLILLKKTFMDSLTEAQMKQFGTACNVSQL